MERRAMTRPTVTISVTQVMRAGATGPVVKYRVTNVVNATTPRISDELEEGAIKAIIATGTKVSIK
jgi:hypothetical protein